MTYNKVRFVGKYGETAGLVIPTSVLNERTFTVGKLSSYFPESEAMKMGKCQISPAYSTFEDAFEFNFNDYLWSDDCNGVKDLAIQFTCNPMLIN